MRTLNFLISLKFPHSLGRLTIREVPRTLFYSDRDLVLFHLQ